MGVNVTNAFSGAWTWFNDPRSIVVSSVPYVGTISPQGSPVVTTLGMTVPLRPIVLTQLLEPSGTDDHDNPTFLRRASDGRIMAFYCGHNEAGMFLRISTNPDDMSSFGAEVNLDASFGGASYTYTNPLQLTGETDTPIYLFTRMDNGVDPFTMFYSRSTDDGVTWPAATKLLTGTRPYFRVVRNGTSRIDICCNNGHPNAVATNSVYHFYYDNGTWRNSTGVDIGAPPFDPATDLTEVYDGSGVNGNSWVWDIKIASDGEPVIYYATFPTTSDHRYRRARFNGTTWDDFEVTAAGGALYAGEPYYSGGVWGDPDDVDTIFCSRELTGVFQVFRYVTADDGANWTGTQLTSGAQDSFRPVIVDGAAEPRLAYVNGVYTSFTEFQTVVELMDSSATPAPLDGFTSEFTSEFA